MSITISQIAANSTHLSGNPLRVKLTTSAIPTGAVGYKLLLKIVSIDDVLVGTPFIDDKTPDTNLAAEFDISGYVDQAIQKDFAFPVTAFLRAYTSMSYDIHLYAGETYIGSDGVPVENTELTLLQPVFIVKGKLPTYELAKLQDASSSWFADFVEGGKFLTFSPTTQQVSPYQPVKLWMKWPSLGPDSVEIKMFATYDDGTTLTYTKPTSLSRASLYEINAMPELFGFTLDNGTKKIVQYRVWAEFGGEVVTEFRTFVIDWDYHQRYWYLFADNRIGGIECIWLKGSIQFAPTGQRTTGVKPLGAANGVKIPTIHVGSSSRRRKWSVNTGYYWREELRAFEILLDTQNAWLAIPPDDGNTDLAYYQLTPVTIGNAEMLLTDNGNFEPQSVVIELLEAHS